MIAESTTDAVLHYPASIQQQSPKPANVAAGF